MKELSVSQAQKQFTALLSATEITTIIDKKSHLKKAVLIPYPLYEQLMANNEHKMAEQQQELDSFVGLLSEEFITDDAKYNAIVK
jgi:hypothetical protein